MTRCRARNPAQYERNRRFGTLGCGLGQLGQLADGPMLPSVGLRLNASKSESRNLGRQYKVLDWPRWAYAGLSFGSFGASLEPSTSNDRNGSDVGASYNCWRCSRWPKFRTRCCTWWSGATLRPIETHRFCPAGSSPSGGTPAGEEVPPLSFKVFWLTFQYWTCESEKKHKSKP